MVTIETSGGRHAVKLPDYIKKRIGPLHKYYHILAQRRDKDLNEKEFHTRHTIAAYRGDPVQIEYIDSMRELSYIIQDVQRAIPEGKDPGCLGNHDLYTKPVKALSFFRKTKGVSLEGIERMSLPLGQTDVGKIDRVMQWKIQSWLYSLPEPLTRFSPFPRSDLLATRLIQDSILLLATQPIAQADRVRVPTPLKSLHNRLCDYFDYYLPYVTETNLDKDDELRFLANSSWAGELFTMALGAFIPARLGITPQSAIKLYQRRGLTSHYKHYLNTFSEILTTQAHEAYRKDKLPPQLEEQQHYSEENERAILELLTPYYQTRQSSPAKNEVLPRLDLYQSQLRSDILSSPSKALEFELQGHSLFKIAFVTCFYEHAIFRPKSGTSAYQDTLIFVLPLAESKFHLTLEYNNTKRAHTSGKVFGIPPNLEAGNLELTAIIGDIFDPILEAVKSRYPKIEVEPATEIKAQQPQLIFPGLTLKPQRLPWFVLSQPETPKRIGILTPIAQITAEGKDQRKPKIKTRGKNIHHNQPDVPEKNTIETNTGVQVNYSDKMVSNMVGNDKSQIKRFMDTIARFEKTGNGIYPLEAARKRGIEAYALKCGHYRIIFTHSETGGYKLVGIPKRSDYDDRKLDNLLDSI